MSKIKEIMGVSTKLQGCNWKKIIRTQHCPYIGKKCLKTRKSNPEVSIGTCTVEYGSDKKNVIICPHRLLERKQIFIDCLHLLQLHTPGNELHVVPEVSIPGGSVDYFLVSTDSNRKVVDFVGIELQTLDTTGSVWPERQMLLQELKVLLHKNVLFLYKAKCFPPLV
ncbi:MAG: NotI family restriction endonuclease [Bacteroidales bacterium]|nr:NotI family restriction endonuclease [Bacteroidales bacterium]